MLDALLLSLCLLYWGCLCSGNLRALSSPQRLPAMSAWSGISPKQSGRTAGGISEKDVPYPRNRQSA